MPSTPFRSIRNGNFFHGEDRYVYSPSWKRHLKSVRGVGTYSLYYHGRKLLLFLNDLQVFPYILKFLVSQCLILSFKLIDGERKWDCAYLSVLLSFLFLWPPFSSMTPFSLLLLCFLPILLCCLKPQFLLFPLPGPFPSPSLIFSSSPLRRFIFDLQAPHCCQSLGFPTWGLFPRPSRRNSEEGRIFSLMLRSLLYHSMVWVLDHLK